MASILAEAGIEPAPERKNKRTWKQFLRSHWETLYACDFFAVETLGVFGTVRYMVFFVIELKSRAVHLAGMRIDPDGAWMMQMARNLLDPVDGFLRNATHLIHDRDPVFTAAWAALLKSGGVKSCADSGEQSELQSVRGKIRENGSDRVSRSLSSIFGERHLRYLLREFVSHYLMERFHQGLGEQLIAARQVSENDNSVTGAIRCRSRLGGLLNFYQREAA